MRISSIHRSERSVYDRIQALHEHETAQRRIRAIDAQELNRTNTSFPQVMQQLQDPEAPRTLRVIEVLFAPGHPNPRTYRLG
ncbi:hypothetical protein L6R29_18230 [Myxococcota bacterium]|nr:hypothetical protein [Myxococcota bacterium]